MRGNAWEMRSDSWIEKLVAEERHGEQVATFGGPDDLHELIERQNRRYEADYAGYEQDYLGGGILAENGAEEARRYRR